MKVIYILCVFCLVFSAGCLVRDNLPPYQTSLTKNKSGTSMLKAEKNKIVNAAKSLKKQSEDTESLYNEVLSTYTNCLQQLVICCTENNITREKYQQALIEYENKYSDFFTFSKQQLQKTKLSEDTYPIEIAMKRIFNSYRKANQQTKSKMLQIVNTYNLPSFDKL